MAKVEILKVGHALIAGKRGEEGGAPSKDSIWGVATVQGNVVAFWGRRGGKLRFKTATKKDLGKMLSIFEAKVAGKHKGFAYEDLSDNAALIEERLPNLAEMVGKTYYKDMANGKLNAAKRTAAKQKEAKAAAEKAVAVASATSQAEVQA